MTLEASSNPSLERASTAPTATVFLHDGLQCTVLCFHFLANFLHRQTEALYAFRNQGRIELQLIGIEDDYTTFIYFRCMSFNESWLKTNNGIQIVAVIQNFLIADTHFEPDMGRRG